MPSKEGYYENPNRYSPSNEHWLPWLQHELIIHDVLAQTPEMPEPYRPDYEKWREVFERFQIDEETVLVGHSCGGGFLVRWLSENKNKVGKVALVAPWINRKSTRPVLGFFDFALDPELVSRTATTRLFISTDDDKEELDTAELLKNTVKGLTVSQFTDKGHFCYSDLGTDQFPELRDYLLG